MVALNSSDFPKRSFTDALPRFCFTEIDRAFLVWGWITVVIFAIAILHSIQDKYYSAKALQGCLPHFDALATTFPDFAKALETLSYQNRSDLLELLPTLRPIIMRLGEDEETFLDVLQSVREVCKQWP